MNELTKAILLIVGAALTNSLVFARALGVEATLSASGRFQLSLRAGLGTAAVMAVSVPLTRAVQAYALLPLKAEYLTILAAVLIFSLAAWALGKVTYFQPARGVLSLNSLLLGAALAAIKAEYGVFDSLLYGLFSGAGFLLAALMLSAIRERIDLSDAPEAMKGLPLLIVSLGMIALAFAGLSGIGG